MEFGKHLELSAKTLNELVTRLTSLETIIKNKNLELKAATERITKEIEEHDDELDALRRTIADRLHLTSQTIPTSNSSNKVAPGTRQKQIIETLSSYGPLTRKEIASHIGITYEIVSTTVTRLIQLGTIKDCGEHLLDINRNTLESTATVNNNEHSA